MKNKLFMAKLNVASNKVDVVKECIGQAPGLQSDRSKCAMKNDATTILNEALDVLATLTDNAFNINDAGTKQEFDELRKIRDNLIDEIITILKSL